MESHQFIQVLDETIGIYDQWRLRNAGGVEWSVMQCLEGIKDYGK